LQKDGVPNKAVEEHFKETKKHAAAKRKRSQRPLNRFVFGAFSWCLFLVPF
jgi:hypothetical protein